MKNSQQNIGWNLPVVGRCRFGFVLGALLMLCAVLSLSLSSNTAALTTVPTKMNFQGRLTDSSGNIMPNGTYNMKLRLYTVNSGGSAVWTEDRLVSAGQGVTLTNGLFFIKLGDVAPLSATHFASGELYLEVELPTPATATSSSPSWTEGAMTPRNQMATSAYAYNSEMLDGIDSSGFIQNTTSPQTANFNVTGNGIIGGNLEVAGATAMGGPLTLSYATVTDTPTTQLVFGNAYDSLGVPSSNKISFFEASGTTVGIGVSAYDFDLFTAENFKFHRQVSGVLTEDIAVINNTGITSIGILQGTRLISTVATGTAPLTVASATKVANLNVDQLDGLDSAAFGQLGAITNTWSGAQVFNGEVLINNGANPVTISSDEITINAGVNDLSINGGVVMNGGTFWNYNSTRLVNNTADAFSVSSSIGTDLFKVNSSSGQVSIGDADVDGTGVVLVLDTKNTAGDPTGVDGAMYYNSSMRSFRCYKSGAWRGCMGGLAYANTVVSNSVVNTITETNFDKNYTIPAGDCQPGKVYRVTARGVYSTQNWGLGTASTLTIRLKVGTTVIGDTGAINPQANRVNRQWTLDFNLTCLNASSTGSVEGQGLFTLFTAINTPTSAELLNTAPITGINFSTSQTLQLSAQWSTAYANSTVTLRQLVVEELGP